MTEEIPLILKFKILYFERAVSIASALAVREEYANTDLHEEAIEVVQECYDDLKAQIKIHLERAAK